MQKTSFFYEIADIKILCNLNILAKEIQNIKSWHKEKTIESENVAGATNVFGYLAILYI